MVESSTEAIVVLEEKGEGWEPAGVPGSSGNKPFRLIVDKLQLHLMAVNAEAAPPPSSEEPWKFNILKKFFRPGYVLPEDPEYSWAGGPYLELPQRGPTIWTTRANTWTTRANLDINLCSMLPSWRACWARWRIMVDPASLRGL